LNTSIPTRLATSPALPRATRAAIMLGVCLCGSGTGNASAGEQGIAGNAAELHELLVGDRPPVELQTINPQRGCGPAGCRIDVGDVSIAIGKGTLTHRITRADGRQEIALVEHRASGAETWPDIDWPPLRSYRVNLGGMPWGLCMEFSHAGMGRSGSAQRWRSLVLLPDRADETGSSAPSSAHRFMGYWALCRNLTQATRPGHVELPMVEAITSADSAAATQKLVLRIHDCDAQGCSSTADPRAIHSKSTGSPAQPVLLVGKR
jgi:hypothetical protein